MKFIRVCEECMLQYEKEHGRHTVIAIAPIPNNEEDSTCQLCGVCGYKILYDMEVEEDEDIF